MHYELSAREPHIFLFKRYIDDIDDVSDELFPLGLEEVKSPSRRSSLAIGKKRSSLAMEEKIKAKDVRYSLRRQKNL